MPKIQRLGRNSTLKIVEAAGAISDEIPLPEGVILRDEKNYPLIKVTTRDPWPRVMVTRKRLRDGNRYFGPYSSGTAMQPAAEWRKSAARSRQLHDMAPRLQQLENLLATVTPAADTSSDA